MFVVSGVQIPSVGNPAAILHTARRQFYYRHEWVYVAPESPLRGLVSPDAVRKSKNFRFAF